VFEIDNFLGAYWFKYLSGELLVYFILFSLLAYKVLFILSNDTIFSNFLLVINLIVYIKRNLLAIKILTNK